MTESKELQDVLHGPLLEAICVHAHPLVNMYIGSPVVSNGEVIGTVTLYNHDTQKTESDFFIDEVVARQIAYAMMSFIQRSKELKNEH